MSNPNSFRRLVPKVDARTRSASPTDDGSSASKRRCISSACMQCRKRKSKCDGDIPACENCSIVYKTECTYDIDTDHRRKGALKRDIRQLQGENEKRDFILDAIRKGSEADVDDIIQLVRSEEPLDSIIGNIKKMPGKPMPNPETSSTLEGELAACPGKTSLANARVTQHYGLTANLALVESFNNQPLPSVATDPVGTWTNVTNDVEFENHLFNLYFTWPHPFYLLFPEEAFKHDFKEKQLNYCSSLLVNAVLAVACNYSDRPEARADPDDPATVGDHFFAEARRLLAEDDRSCLTTVQALGVMCLRQAMNNHESSGWKLCCQSMAMAVELGLHLTCNAQLNEATIISDVEARRITFWGNFMLSTLWAVCVGRISCLPTTAIQSEKLILRDNLEKKVWRPHGDPRFPHESTSLEQPAFNYNLLVQLSYLTEIVNDVIHMFYAPRDRVTSRKLRQHHQRYHDWYLGLPSMLAIKQDGPTLPQVISLHIYYHNCILLLFRPYLRLSFVQNAKSPREICTEAAITISKLMTLYYETYGMRRACFVMIHSSTSASIQHLVNISLQPSISAEATDHLTSTLRMLHEMHPTYPRLTAYFEVIRCLVAKWLPVIPRNVDEALQAFGLPSPLYSGSTSALSLSDPISHTHYPTAFDELTCLPLGTNDKSKASAPSFAQVTPNYSNGLGGLTAGSQNFLWTPFPESMYGIPVMPPERRNSNYNMDISRVLDSGIDGDWGQLNRDGFTVDTRWETWGGI